MKAYLMFAVNLQTVEYALFVLVWTWIIVVSHLARCQTYVPLQMK